MKYAIVVAGGKGLRMGGDVPKQFQLLHGRPILMRTLERLHASDADLNLILVLPLEQQAYWKQLCETYHFELGYQLANGGETRFHSVKNGLSLVPDDAEGVVAVHDGVRPFVSTQVVRECLEQASICGAVIPVIGVVETIRHLTASGSETKARDEYRLVQTPQVFDIQLLKKAYLQPYTTFFTDDASVVESLGVQVTLVEGNRENIKITTPYDAKIGEVLAAEQDNV